MNTDKDDLWQSFLDEDDVDLSPKEEAKDGTEWTGRFDRRKTPRDEAGNTSETDSRIAPEGNSESD